MQAAEPGFYLFPYLGSKKPGPQVLAFAVSLFSFLDTRPNAKCINEFPELLAIPVFLFPLF